MEYLEAKPSPRLAGYIKCFWSIRSDVGSVGPEPVLPDGCPEIVFNLADRFRRIHPDGSHETQAAAIVSGQLRSSISIMPTGRVELFGVRFHPSGAFPLLRTRMHELTDRVEALDSLIGHDGSEILERIAAADSFRDRVLEFERFLLRSLAGSVWSDDLPGRLSRIIIERRGQISVSGLCASTGLGERRLERTFQRFVGLSPKTFARIVRFQNVVRRIEQAESTNLLDTALDLGYYDQSHMVREFREFAGKSPLAYFEETHRISELFTTSAPVSDSYNTAETPQR
jgi:AraC-like DNA-binding protein